MTTASTATCAYENIPICLRKHRQWVCWRFITRNGKATKCPFNARTGTRAKSTDPKTWSSFEQAIQACLADNRYAGIGFVFAADDPYCGIDLDDCLDPKTGELKPWARRLIDQLDSYTEVSPSGTGVKIIVETSKPDPRCKKAFEDGHVEVYDHGRFFTITGRHLQDTPDEVRPRQEQVEELYKRVFGAPKPSHSRSAPPAPNTGHTLSDEEIIEKARHNKKGGAKFEALWSGNWDAHFSSQSEADSSLVFSLAYYTKDAPQIDRIFRDSGLMRQKWDQKRGEKTYGQITIDNALVTVTAQCKSHPETHRNTQAHDGDHDPQRDPHDLIELGRRDPKTGRLVLSPNKTLPTAEAFVKAFYSHSDGLTLRTYADIFMTWHGNRYVEIEEAAMRHCAQPWLHGALRYICTKKNGPMELVDFESNSRTISAAIDSIRDYTHLPASVTPPCWLDDGSVRPDPQNLLAFPSGTLDLATERVLPPTPVLFNINAIDFDYDPDPPVPERWISFLEQLWGDDLESVQLLQEWMGYSLVADTSQQKMLLIVGPRRSGKGTIGRVLRQLAGAGNVVGPTTSSLAENFGLQPLIGKSLAIVSDARFSGKSIGVVVERLLCISGEDVVTVDRKFLGAVTMKLATRFMFLTNELPRMNDASGALAGRFVILRLTSSFYGQEDITLTQQLMEELPGILHWSIEGLRRLRDRGHFVQPASVAEAVQQLEDLASPVRAFVCECCITGPGHRVSVDELYDAWKIWCEQDGRTLVTNKQTFGRDLAAAVPGVVRRRGTCNPFYEGIELDGAGG